MLKAERLQSWFLEAPEGISTCCQATVVYLHLLLGLTVSGILSLGKRWARDILGRDSQEGACHLADGHHSQCPQGQVTCFVISFSFPLGPQIFLSLCIRKTDSDLRWFQLLVTKTESWCHVADLLSRGLPLHICSWQSLFSPPVGETESKGPARRHIGLALSAQLTVTL